MAYFFRVCRETLGQVLGTGRYEDVAAFLVIARHANGRPPAGIDPHTVSGAGVNAVHEKAGLSEETARGAVQRLVQAGFIRPATADLRALSPGARWLVAHANIDLDLPHALTDSVAGESALRRIKSADMGERKGNSAFDKISDADLRLDLLRTLLMVYVHTSMTRFGGLSPMCCRRLWETKSQKPKAGGVRWGVEPVHDSAYHAFIAECIPAAVKTKSQIDATRFWFAWEALKKLGLMYEAVTLFDVDPSTSGNAERLCTLRVNDLHASTSSSGDPSLLASLESHSGSRHAFYTNKSNDRGEPEAMWVILPREKGVVIGIWRPRFRASNLDAGSWYEDDGSKARQLSGQIISSDPESG